MPINTPVKDRRPPAVPLLTPLLLTTLLLTACAGQPPRGGSVADDINQSLQHSAQQSAATAAQPLTPPPAVDAALLPPLNVELSGVRQEPVARRFDVAVNNASAKSFFMSLVEGTPYNMVAHPAIKGRISLNLKNVTIDEVMETVRNVFGYEYKRTRHGFEVLPAALRSHVFSIDYLNVRRSGLSNVQVSSGQVSSAQNGNSGSGSSSGDSGSNSGSNSASNSGSNNGNASVSGSQISTHSSSDFWVELTAALEAIIGNEGGRKVIVNPQSGIVVVRAMPAELRAISEYLHSTQTVIERQVILEAKILEVELSDGFQSGVNWSALGKGSGSDTVLAGQFGGATVFDTGYSNLQGQVNALNPANLAAVRSDVASAFGGMFAMSLNLGDFTGFLEFLETQGDVHVLSSPRVSTVNNQKAVIKVGSDEFFVTDVDTNDNTTAGSTTTNQSVDIELTPFFSGVALDVIPQISADGVVTLHIHPSVSEVNERIKQISLNASNQLTIPLALSTIRESDSIVRARSGQVVVIGGLMQNQTRDSTSSVPLLGDLPLIGGLFRHKQQVTRKSELVILLRPIVVENDKTWADEIAKTTGNFGNITQFSQDH
ncbi:MAG: pilus (MSHA type) biogenesis protein MshL [Gammaproteobacteria bacterium]|nr:pilus (MSHA type) biogenesis protein MshL [Gammaproteobacteria bacterium]